MNRFPALAGFVVTAGCLVLAQPPRNPPNPDPAPTSQIVAVQERADGAIIPRAADVKAEIGRVLDDFHGSASKADFDRYFGNMTDDAVFLGTDATERWIGQEFRDFARPYFDQGKGWTYRPRDRVINVGESAAWFDELLDNDKLGTCRGSGVLVKVGDAWKIAQYNLSIPIPNDLAEKVTALIREMPDGGKPVRGR